MNEMWIDLNEFYYALGLPSTKLGNQMGFDLDKGEKSKWTIAVN